MDQSALTEFRHYRWQEQNGSGLLVPSSTLAEIAAEVDTLDKADQRVQAMQSKIGSLFSWYYSVWANMVTWGAAEKPRGTPRFRLLRETSSRSLLDALLINARLHQVRHVAHRVVVQGREKGWKVVHKLYDDPNFKVDDATMKRCLQVEDLLEAPNPEIHPTGMKDFMLKAVQGELILDRKAMVLVAGQDRRPRSFHLLPPDGIRPRFEVLFKYMTQFPGITSPTQAVEYIFNTQKVDISNAAYVQVLDDGRIYGAWDKDEISVDITNPSDEIDRWGFGVSCLERSLEATTILLRAIDYNKTVFESNYPEAFLVFSGKVSQEGLDAFKKMLYAQVGPGGNQRLPVFATGEVDNIANKAQLLRLRDTFRDMSFPQLLRFFVALKAAAYRAHPSLLNMAPDSGGMRPLINSETQEEAIALAQEEGLHALLDNLADWLTRALVKPWYDDLKLIFTVQDAPKELEELQIWTMKTQVGMTVNEFRAAQGLKPLEEVSGVDGNFIANPLFFQQKQMAMMEQQAQMQQSQAAAYGEPGGFDGMEPGAGGAQPPPGASNGGQPQGLPGGPAQAAQRLQPAPQPSGRPQPATKSLTITLED